MLLVLTWAPNLRVAAGPSGSVAVLQMAVKQHYKDSARISLELPSPNCSTEANKKRIYDYILPYRRK